MAPDATRSVLRVPLAISHTRVLLILIFVSARPPPSRLLPPPINVAAVRPETPANIWGGSLSRCLQGPQAVLETGCHKICSLRTLLLRDSANAVSRSASRVVQHRTGRHGVRELEEIDCGEVILCQPRHTATPEEDLSHLAVDTVRHKPVPLVLVQLGQAVVQKRTSILFRSIVCRIPSDPILDRTDTLRRLLLTEKPPVQERQPKDDTKVSWSWM